MPTERLTTADLHRENRQLRVALETLLNELDGEGPPDCDCVRAELPTPKGIVPPWEREGFESKDEWLAKRRS